MNGIQIQAHTAYACQLKREIISHALSYSQEIQIFFFYSSFFSYLFIFIPGDFFVFFFSNFEKKNLMKEKCMVFNVIADVAFNGTFPREHKCEH